ncbi:DUF3667 domain-containing protein [Pedobacter sp. ASV12]|uniref:DUF3667 domain-containing protein n=1 Tax=Pedobacter sp. ASV12 TaxID=2795120 RepID=UPI0018ED41CD|nr:DUF3667 domain-containing protein [Pedobacter sp. ASV12]
MSAGKYRKDHTCLNCGFHVEEHYCSRCGQANLELKENLWHFITHSIAHYFHFDNKFFKTLSPLLTKPGQVTLDYLAGKRARYINPVNMYIFVSIIYFLVAYSPKRHEKPEVETQTEKAIGQNDKTVDSINNVLADAGLDKAIGKKATQTIAAQLEREQFRKMSFKNQEFVLQKLDSQYKANKSDVLAKTIDKYKEIHTVRNDSTYEAYLARQNKLPLLQRDGWFQRFVKKRSFGIGENSELINEKLEHNRPKQYFLLMPLMALFIMVNFRKNHIYYMDHLIFTIHGMTAFFLISIITQTLTKYIFGPHSTISDLINVAMLGWILWYMYKALTLFYQRKRKTTIWRMIWIFVLYGISIKITEVIIVNVIYYLAM